MEQWLIRNFYKGPFTGIPVILQSDCRRSWVCKSRYEIGTLSNTFSVDVAMCSDVLEEALTLICHLGRLSAELVSAD